MTDTWTTFLLERQACYEHGVLRHFGNPQVERSAMRGRNILTDLAALSLLRASGPDALSFLNGQLTNDLKLLEANRSQLAAWCTAQGRMLAVFRVFRRDADIYLQLPVSLRDEAVKRLRMFVLRAKVTIASADDELVRFGLVGPDAAHLLHTAAGDAPKHEGDCLARDALTLLRLPGIHPRFEIVAPPDTAIALWSKLANDAMPVGTDAWFWHDVMAGVPTVLPETREAFIPQMANLEIVGGVNFKKGCYPGQEIVARMQYLGRLKQRMYRAHAETEAIAPGTPIYAPNANEQSVGTVVDARPSPTSGVDLLAVIQIAAVDAGELRLGGQEGTPLTEVVPPYSLDTAETQKAS